MSRSLPPHETPGPRPPAGAVRRASATVLAFGVMVAGCVSEVSPEGAQVLLPDATSFAWGAVYDAEDDGLVALVPLDVLVYDGFSGQPLAWADVTLRARAGDSGRVALVGAAQVDRAVPYDRGVSGFGGLGTPALGPVDGPEAGVLLWDVYRDEAVALSADGLDASATDGLASGSADLVLPTDEHGLARVYLMVDRLGASEGGPGEGFAPVEVLATVGGSAARVAVQAR